MSEERIKHGHCFTPDYTSATGENHIGIVTEGLGGYTATPLSAPNLDEAEALCDNLNGNLGHSRDEWRAMVARALGDAA